MIPISRARLFGHRRGAARRPDHDAAVDAVIDGYVAWREAAALVQVGYSLWGSSERSDRRLAFAGYMAALEREEHAARIYESEIQRARQLLRNTRVARSWWQAQDIQDRSGAL